MNGKKSKFVCMTLVFFLALFMCGSLLAAEEKKEGIGKTGTDPRDFAPKFMPYYRYTELENGLEQNELVLFGLIPLSKKFAMTYEIPLAYERDITDTDAFKNGLSNVPGGGVPLPGDLPIPSSDEFDGKETGIGDMNLRFFYRSDLDFLKCDWMFGAEFVFPTANEDVLGGEQFLIKPMVTIVRDIGFWPAPGAFLALMNFYSFDAWGDSDRDDVSQYIGRYFFMLPVHPSGIYLLPEVQVIYDFENSHFSAWIGPEVGKLLAPGRIIYVKPGFGVDSDDNSGDRKWSFETGFRWFF
ncbi:MAG: hypothetical protein JRI88_05340 [Deltaproteobacteria bacterium]|nr:hypothetical protein [Deltaproteobacteria bacterium]